VLRAIAGTSDGLTTGGVRRRFGMGTSGTTTNAAKALVDNGRMVKTVIGSGYAFDNAFVRGWVVQRALPDLGIRQEIVFAANSTGEYDARSSLSGETTAEPMANAASAPVALTRSRVESELV